MTEIRYAQASHCISVQDCITHYNKLNSIEQIAEIFEIANKIR